MAYQAKKHKRFLEDFELVNENGEVEKTLHVSLDADDMVVKINRKYVALTRALTETNEMQRKAESNENMEDCFEKLGRAVVDLFDAVFGPENTKIIVEFYENRYIEMVKEISPFITQIVIPRCMEIRKENADRVLHKYNRSQRRSIFKGLV